jgi:MFS family permease
MTTPRANSVPVPLAGATVALVLLTALNFVNYIDRYIIFGVQGLLKTEFHVSDSVLGSLTFWFFATYMVSAPVTGWLGDRFPRKPLIVGCAIMISLVNVFTGTVHSFDSLLFRHAMLGIVEASLGIYAPALLADFYPEDQLNRILTVFYTAIPVGAAIGYLVGEVVGARFDWRTPFYVSAVPGLAIALLVLVMLKEPARRAMSPGHGHTVDRASAFALARNRTYLLAALGMAMITFTQGGISAWMPTFLERSGYSHNQVGITLGAITAACGLGGTAVGGIVAQRLLRTRPNALFLVSAWSSLLAIPPGLLCFFGPKAAMLPALTVGLFFVFVNTGPLNAAIINSVPAAVRSSAIAVELFLIHVLGDTPSPKLIGMVSDRSTLATGLGLTLVSLLFAAVFLFVGARSRKVEFA